MNDRTVIISCAGMGTRLGAGKPKALIDIEGKPLIIRTLEMLDDIEDVRVVVGYQAEKVIECVNSYRKDVIFVYNHNYKNNGTGASVSLAAKYAKKYILTIDGDVLMHPEDMKKILTIDHEFVGVCKPGTDDPVLTKVDDNDNVIGFARGDGKYEWTGITMLETAHIKYSDGHTYTIIEPLLPMKPLFLRQKEVDTPNDYRNAIKWIANNYEED